MVEEEVIQTEACSPTIVSEVRFLHDRPRIPQDAGRPLRVCEEFRRRRFPDTLAICGRHVDRQTKLNQIWKSEESLEPNLLNERFGSGKTDTGDAHKPRLVEKIATVIIAEVCDKGA